MPMYAIVPYTFVNEANLLSLSIIPTPFSQYIGLGNLHKSKTMKPAKKHTSSTVSRNRTAPASPMPIIYSLDSSTAFQASV